MVAPLDLFEKNLIKSFYVVDKFLGLSQFFAKFYKVSWTFEGTVHTLVGKSEYFRV